MARVDPFLPTYKSKTQFLFDVVAGQVLCDVHGLTAPIWIEIDGADPQGNFEGGGIELFVPLSDAHQGVGH